jgi:hypothetical protein
MERLLKLVAIDKKIEDYGSISDLYLELEESVFPIMRQKLKEEMEKLNKEKEEQ